eukprot:CAMPEP_0198222638 /NCGR_PEP_ID=MMETSP1445-20131203/88983_1 /TAXON_ID=36898 /ORGANISM="Pyramimonas sp., Strain CCMP2087" /LENGTH=376 /DNA_ID=CAMNT_0043901213 /DNA_START=114 /DNA_END=1244 /DNA_ORIENTATION=+
MQKRCAILLLAIACPLVFAKGGPKPLAVKKSSGMSMVVPKTALTNGAGWLKAHPAFGKHDDRVAIKKTKRQPVNVKATIASPHQTLSDVNPAFTLSTPALFAKRVHNGQLDKVTPAKLKHDFLIISEQRSGTGYLVALLNAHPNITCEYELFKHSMCLKKDFHKCHEDKMDRAYGYKGKDAAQKKACRESSGLQVDVKPRPDGVQAQPTGLCQEAHTPSDVPLAQESAPPADQQVGLGKHACGTPDEQERYPAGPEVQTKSAHQDDDTQFDEILIQRNDVENWWAANYGEANVWTVSYENILADQQGALRKIAKFIGVPPYEKAIGEEHMSEHEFVQKIHVGMPIVDTISNPAEVIELLKSNPKYKQFLLDGEPDD